MAVILLILKIIGIVLLVLLGLILLALVLVLFVPVRYRISGDIRDGTSVRIMVTWLLHLVRFDLTYEDGDTASDLRILGIRKKVKRAAVDSGEDWEEETEEEDGTSEEPIREADGGTPGSSVGEAAASVKTDGGSTEEDSGNADAGTPGPSVGEAAASVKTDGGTIEEDSGNADAGTPGEHGGSTEEDSGNADGGTPEMNAVEADMQSAASKSVSAKIRKVFEKIKSVFIKIKAFFTGIPEKWKRLKKSMRSLKLKALDIKNMLTDENNKAAVIGILGELKYLLCHFKFRKIETDLTFSLGDPALTGQALGGLCMLPFLYQYQVQLYPDFEAEKTYVKGTFEIKGRARAVHVLVSAVRLIKKKEVRSLLKKLWNR